MHQQIAIQLGTLPLQLILISTGQIGIAPMGHFPEIWDCPSEKTDVSAFISPYKLVVNDKEVPYNKAIRFEDYPKLKDWVKSMNMNNPF